jgi:hypothetical protein
MLALPLITTLAMASPHMARSPVKATEITLDVLSSRVTQFALDCGRLPAKSEFPRVLLERSGDCWRGPYIEPRWAFDDWRQPLRYEGVDASDRHFDLRSIGGDGIDGTGDDIRFGDATRSWAKHYPPMPDCYARERQLTAFMLELAIIIVAIKIKRAMRRRLFGSP